MSMKNPRLQSILRSEQECLTSLPCILQSAWGGKAKQEFSHWHEGSDEGKIPQGRQLHQHIFLIYTLNSASIPQGPVTDRTSINTLNSYNLCTIASLMKTPPPFRLEPCLKAITFRNTKPAINQSKEKQGSLQQHSKVTCPLPCPLHPVSLAFILGHQLAPTLLQENSWRHNPGKRAGKEEMRPELRRQRRLGQRAGAEETGMARGPILTLGRTPFLGELWNSLRSGPLVSDLSHRSRDLEKATTALACSTFLDCEATTVPSSQDPLKTK